MLVGWAADEKYESTRLFEIDGRRRRHDVAGECRAGKPAAEYCAGADRRSGLWGHRVPGKSGGQDTEYGSAARRKPAAHRLSREPDLLADAHGDGDGAP